MSATLRFYRAVRPLVATAALSLGLLGAFAGPAAAESTNEFVAPSTSHAVQISFDRISLTGARAGTVAPEPFSAALELVAGSRVQASMELPATAEGAAHVCTMAEWVGPFSDEELATLDRSFTMSRTVEGQGTCTVGVTLRHAR